MKPIVPPLKPNENGPDAVNLTQAMLLLVERKVITALDPPNRPTADELKKLSEAARAELAQSQFGKATRQLVIFFQIQQGLGENLRGLVEDTTAAKLNEWLEKLGQLDHPETDGFVVRGTVKDSNGQPLARAVVRAFDRDLRKEQKLGEATTDDQGQYLINYGLKDFASGDLPSTTAPTLIVRSFLGEQQIGDDVTRAKATRDEVVNFEQTAPVVSEWDRLCAGVIPLLEGQGKDGETLPPWELNDGDFDFIAGETGLEKEQIRLWALAFVVVRDAALVTQTGGAITLKNFGPQVRPDAGGLAGLSNFAIFYGWFRLGLPTQPRPLWATPTATLLATLKAAIEQHLVPSSIGADLDAISARIEQSKLDLVLQTPGAGTTARLADLLETLPAPLQPEQQRAIAAILPDLQLDDPKLVNRIAELPGLTDNAIPIARTLRLDALTSGHLPLAKALQDRLTGETAGTLRPLASLRPDEWLDLAYTHGTPNDTISPVAYADTLAASVEQQHPTAALTAHFANGRRLSQQDALGDVGTFLLNNPSFDIVTANLNMPFESSDLGGVSNREQLGESLRILQRMNTLEARWDEAATLLENGLLTPQHFLEAGPEQLTVRLAGQLTPERVAELHERAEDLFTNTFAAFTAALSPFNAPRIMPEFFISGVTDPHDLGNGGIPPTVGPIGPGSIDPTGTTTLINFVRPDLSIVPRLPAPTVATVIPDRSPVPNFIKDAIVNQPTLQALFGAQDSCVCGHCNSVLSPAAYFVDVLQFLKNAGVLGEVEGNSGLLALRPDLQDLELSCNNTNTEVPAIDLALEILENAAGLPLDVPLPAGTDIDAQLSGPRVGEAVKTALEKTVRGGLGELNAIWEDSAWTVVDGHRRWSLTTEKEAGLWAEKETGRPQRFETTELNLPQLIAALNEGRVTKGAEAALLKLFPASQRQPDLADYEVTIIPEVVGQSWRVKYRSVAKLFFPNSSQLILQNSKGKTWFEQEYNSRTIAEIRSELDRGKSVPVLVQKLLAQRFLSTGLLVLEGSSDSWTIKSPQLELTLRFKAAQIRIASLTYQSGDSQVDAIAWPANHNPAAYAKLKGKDAVFPWSLPVDLPLEEVRLFLDRARCSRRRLIKLMLPVDQPTKDDIVFSRELLGLSEAEAKLIVQQPTSPDQTFACWGLASTQKSIWDAAAGAEFKAASPLELLKNVSILLQQSGLTFEELQALLATRFVSSVASDALLIKPADTCVPSSMRLNALTPEHLDRIHRFVRLRRRLGWSTEELDQAIQISPGKLLDGQTHQWLAQLVRVGELLDLSVAKMLALLKNPAPISERLAVIARALALSNRELEHARLLFGSDDLFTSLDTLLDFCERVKNYSSGGIMFEDLRYLLQHHDSPGANATLDEKQLAQLANSARDAVRSIVDQPVLLPLPEATDAESTGAALAIKRNREDAVIAALATSLSAPPELVDDLLRTRLRDPADSSKAAIAVLLRSSQLSANDLSQVEDFIKQLRTASTPVIEYLMKRFSDRDRDVLMDRGAAMQELQDTMIAALNQVLQGASIYDKSRFSGIHVSAETLALVSQNQTGAELARLNRQLLEEAFPKNIRSTRLAIRAVLLRLHKTVFICNALKLGPIDLRLLRKPVLTTGPGGLSEPDLGLTALNFNSLPVEETVAPAILTDFEQLNALVRLRNISPSASDMLQQDASLNSADTEYVEKAQTVLAIAMFGGGTKEDLKEVEDTSRQLHITTVDQYRDPMMLERLIGLLGALRQLGATVQQAIDLTAAAPGDDVAVSARELLRRRFGDSPWHDLIKPIADRLRVRQRDALVDYLIAESTRVESSRTPGVSGPRRLRNADDLYERYLIDVQTSSCMKTTRLLQATAAAQLFIQRLLLNLQGPVTLSADKRQLWDWMHHYRVWEANRKVFLFPENWLLPELRDDKTAAFRQMESALTEGEPSSEVTRAALLAYVEDLGDLAHITVIAMYQDRRITGKDEHKNDIVEHTLHVIGRTLDQPYRYFWRSCANFGIGTGMSWSGWEALDLDNANDFIMPFVFEGELHLAWPIFRKTKEETTNPNNDGKPVWEVQLAWTRRTNKGWIKRKIGKAQLDNIKRLPNKDEAASFAFRFDREVLPVTGSDFLTREKISIHCFAANEATVIPELDPNPSLLENTKPVGLSYDARNGPGAQWNVSCEVEGVVFNYVDKPGGGRLNAPCEGATVTLMNATRQDHSDVDTITALPDYPCTTRAGGTFKFSFPTSQTGRNGGEGLLNGGSFKLRFEIPGQAVAIERPAQLVQKNPGFADQYSLNWSWKINVGVEDKKLEEHFLKTRPVQFGQVGTFILQTGSDLTSKNTESTPLRPEMSNFAADNNALSVRLNTPLSVVRAMQSSGFPERNIWSLKDAKGDLYYFQIADGKWHRWPDGQPFAPSYRAIVTLSTSALFSRQIQSHLHFDPDANNFERSTAYANYNWELFLHVPLAIADHLAGYQRFEDARGWLHAIFDPTVQASANGVFEFWRFLPFSNEKQPDAIAKLLAWLADPRKVDPGDTKDIEDNLKYQIQEWKKNPFMPHVIARMRTSAYQWHTFFAYLDVLIGWGDQQFRRDTRESVNEATLLYVLAAKLLGPRPRVIPPTTPPPPRTYRSLKANGLDEFGNAWLSYSDLPGIKKLSSSRGAATTARTTPSSQRAATASTVTTIGKALEHPPKTPKTPLTSLSGLAFCIPPNEKLTDFYDLIEKRLSEVRNCRNIDGVFRDLPLFEPPIDPLLLIRARAAGLDIDSVIGGLEAPLPHYRFNFTLQKALELASELKSLGAALLAALEKKDAEELALLRSTHEISMLKLVSDTRQQQVAEAEANIAALRQNEQTILERFGQYQKLLGKTGITSGQDGLPVVEQSSSLSVSTDPVGGVSGLGLSRMEVDQLSFTEVAHNLTQAVNSGYLLAGILSIFPNIWAGGIFAGQTFGGANLGNAASAIAKAMEMLSAEASFLANRMGTLGGYERRQDEWIHQSKLALGELKLIKQQILAAEIRKEIAKLELRNHEKQIENAKTVDDFMRTKFTNQQLYRWMASQIAEVYFRTYQLALDQARRAERAYQFELGLDTTTTSFVRADYWDSLKKGLMAADRLYHDLKRMDIAYLNQNRREFELTKHISLSLLDPLALVKLRETGQCRFDLLEEIFDLDYPGHYFRRIKSVSLTLPSVVGPYTTISCTLRLLKNSIRIKTTNGDNGYPRNKDGEGLPADDARFVENNLPVKAIAVSGAQNDSGVFELNFRDERYLPFEGAGAVSRWSLELFNDSNSADFGKALRQYDYATISDAILHVRYTAREDAGEFKDRAVAHLRDYFGKDERTPSIRLFNLRQEFPTQWHRFLNPSSPASANVFELEMSPGLFPFRDREKRLKINTISLLARCTNVGDYAVALNPPLPAADQLTLRLIDDYGGLHFSQKNVAASAPPIQILPTAPAVKWQLEMTGAGGGQLNITEVEDLLLVLGYEWT